MACVKPYFVTTGGRTFPVPCNQCFQCKIRRVNEWVFRIRWEEENNSVSSYFVTLTYNTQHVPLTPHGFMTLHKPDVQKFFKRLRKLHSPTLPPIKYFLCGEYGGVTSRPHYHAIILNVSHPDLFGDAWSLHGSPIGTVHIGQVSGDSIAYTLKYMDKENMWSRKYRHARDDRQKEFQLQSQGLGKGYVTPITKDYHTSSLDRNYIMKPGGHRVSLPRYYRNMIYTDDEKEQQHYVIEAALEQADKKAELAYNRRKLSTSYAEHKQRLIAFKKKKYIDRLKSRDKF